MVRDCEFLDNVTVYRPGIIFGDSRTGYTSTFHGFYVPLKLVSSMISKTAGMGLTSEMMEAIIQALWRTAAGNPRAFRNRAEELRPRRLGFRGNDGDLYGFPTPRKDVSPRPAAEQPSLGVSAL